MTFQQKLSAYVVGHLTAKDLPGMALTALEEGYDSESLVILAGYDEADNAFVMEDYFKKTLNELGLQLKEDKVALIDVLKYYAQEIVDKKVDPYTGFEKMKSIVDNTMFDLPDIGLMDCHIESIEIWETMSGGLNFHTILGLTKSQFIEKKKEEMRMLLRDWL